MMLAKRKFLTALAALTLTFTMGAAHAGDDPITGIDIIIKKNPGSQPFKSFSFGAAELKAINGLKNADRPAFTLKQVAKHTGAGGAFVEAGLKAYSEQGCPPKSWTYCGDPEVIEVGEISYTMQIIFGDGKVATPAKIKVPKPIKGSPRLQKLPVE